MCDGVWFVHEDVNEVSPRPSLARVIPGVPGCEVAEHYVTETTCRVVEDGAAGVFFHLVDAAAGCGSEEALFSHVPAWEGGRAVEGGCTRRASKDGIRSVADSLPGDYSAHLDDSRFLRRERGQVYAVVVPDRGGESEFRLHLVSHTVYDRHQQMARCLDII